MTAKSVDDYNREDVQLCKEAQEFKDIYYDIIDRRREKVVFLYTNAATLVWNGNPVDGAENILKFFTTVPTTQHQVTTLDAQNFPDGMSSELAGGMILKIAGSVTVNSELVKSFTQTLLLVLEDGKFRIKNDQFRYLD